MIDITLVQIFNLGGRNILQVGITAAQIISFLRANAHPAIYAVRTECGGVIHSVPITVADQIRLWEDERRRLVLCNAAIYSSFESEKEYFGLKGHVTSQGISTEVCKIIYTTFLTSFYINRNFYSFEFRSNLNSR